MDSFYHVILITFQSFPLKRKLYQRRTFMSQNTCIDEGGKTTQTLPLPSFPSREAVEAHLKSEPDIFRDYLLLPSFMQKELVDFCVSNPFYLPSWAGR